VIKRHTVARLADLTPELLSDVLDAPVADVTITPLSTGNMSASSRLHLRYADGATGPASLVAKMPVDTPEARMVSAYTDRTEIGFYTQIAPRVSIPSPTCYNAGLSQEHGALILLEDITPAVTVDQIDGCTAAQARLAVTNVAGLHASTWNDVEFRDIDFRSPIGPHVLEGMQAMMDAGGPAVIERYGTPADQTEVIRAFTAATTRWFQRRLEPFALLHTDYRLDNLLFAPDPTSERAVVTVDWTTISAGLPAKDVAYFIATGLEPELRRDHERELVSAYAEALAAHGVDYDTVWDDYVYGLFHAVLITVAGAASSQQSERGDAMFRTMMRRACAAIHDTGALSLL
jgi:hypothetical protein